MNDPRDSLSGFSVPMIADTLLGGQPGSRFSASQKLARFLSRHGSSRGRGSDRRGPERLLPHRFTHEFPRRAKKKASWLTGLVLDWVLKNFERTAFSFRRQLGGCDEAFERAP